MVRNCELYEVVKENTFNSCYDKLLCRKCAVIVLRCNFTKHKKREQHIINHLDKDNYEDKIENIKDAYKRNKKPKKKIFLDGQYFDNLEKKQEYFKNKYKKKLQDKDDDLIFLSTYPVCQLYLSFLKLLYYIHYLPFYYGH